MKTTSKANDYRFDFSKYNFENIFSESRYVQLSKLFYEINKVIPIGEDYDRVDWERCQGLLKEKYDFDKNELYGIYVYNSKTQVSEPSFMLIALKQDLFIMFDGRATDTNMSLIYCRNTDGRELDEVRQIIAKSKAEIKTDECIYLLQKNDFGGYYLAPFSISSNMESPLDYYNDDLEGVNELIKNTLNQVGGKGLVMLHGTPGTGKTSYIKYLTTQISKRMIYLSPDMAPLISTPEFLSMIKEYPNSVIILEDAESIIAQRQGGQNSAVSNLLNLTDGILADCLKIQVICTFNTNLNNIDSALLRQGRLIARYEFKPLMKIKAQALSNKLGFTTIIQSDINLNEVVNQNTEFDFQLKKDSKIGF